MGVGILAVGAAALFAQSMRTFSSGKVVTSADINANFSGLDERVTGQDTRLTAAENTITRISPVGTILAWHKNLGPGTLELPAGWLECDGQLVSDAASPFNGQNLPDLNGQRRFLRGSTTSGLLENSQFAQHTHRNNIIMRYGHPTWIDLSSGFHDMGSPFGGTAALNNAAPGGNANVGFAGSGTETRPINMSVVWIIRVK